MLVAEELERRLEQGARRAGRPRQPVYGDMSTGGSRSHPLAVEAHAPGRRAGARDARRRGRGALEGRRRRLPRRERARSCTPPSGRRLAYGALVAAAAKLPVPAAPALREKPPFRLIGTSPAAPRRPRQGRPAPPCSASTCACPACSTPRSRGARCSAARPRSFDAAAALAVPGVVRVEPRRRRRRRGGATAPGPRSAGAAPCASPGTRARSPRSTAPASARASPSWRSSPASSCAREGRGAAALATPRARSRPSTRCPTSPTRRWSP